MFQGIPGGAVAEVVAPSPCFISGLCCRGSLEALLQRAVVYCPRFISGVWFVLHGIPGGVVAKNAGPLSQIYKWCVVCVAGNPWRHCCRGPWPTVLKLKFCG